MTSTHWPYQHFELLSFLALSNNAQAVEWSSQKFVGQGLQACGLAMPLISAGTALTNP